MANNIYEKCPFPAVAESLEPYIKTRQQASYIRQAQQATLPLSSIELLQPASGNEVEGARLGGVRKAYWRALHAHRAAQAKYDALKADIAELVHRTAESSSSATDGTTFLTEEYLPLLHQKERYRKLKVVEATYARLDATGRDVILESLDKVAKRELGEIPGPISAAPLTNGEIAFSAEYDFMQLKKAILSAQQQIEEYEQKSAAAREATAEISPHAELRALQKTHSELTTWMETQLGIISNVDGTKDGSENTKSPSDHSTNVSPTPDDMEDLYEQYLDSRQSLLDTVAISSTNRLDASPQLDVLRRVSDTGDAVQRISLSEVLLSYLPVLVSVKQQEQSSLQESAYTRRQLASVESKARAVLSRLADESHLIQPELSRQSPHGKDWANAAAAAGAATALAASQRISSGQAAAQTASFTLEQIQRTPQILNGRIK